MISIPDKRYTKEIIQEKMQENLVLVQTAF